MTRILLGVLEMNEYNYTIDYNERMLNRYPEVIKAIKEFQELIKTQSLEVEELHEELTKILSNAYVVDSDEAQIERWEKFLQITPMSCEGTYDEWLQDRRDMILSRLFCCQELNTKVIEDIVKIFTGGKAISYFKNNTIYVFISPPRDNKHYEFDNVKSELRNKIPAHLLLHVERHYHTWSEIKDNYQTWGNVNNSLSSWDEVYLWTPII